ncbi:MAG: spore maturation protein [Methylophilales bacterium 28-44-11]|nr:MAG: spore maturation protein [Methylophilales bacterium 28-44-11]
MKKKILILDGIAGVPLGRELTKAISDEGIDTSYLDMKKFDHKVFYGLKSVVYKSLNKIESSDGFYQYPRLNENKFERYIQLINPSIILVIGFVYKFLNPLFLQKMKEKYDIKLFLYDTDSCNLYAKRREFIYFLDNELPVYDEILSFSKVTTRFFKETKKLNASFFPFGANRLNVVSNATFSFEVLFVGSCDLRRIFLLESIKDNVTIYGDRWSRNFPLISDTLKTKVVDQGIWGNQLLNMLVQSKIVLNITRSHFYGVETGVNLRIFEALSAGCFLLSDYSDELAELFDVGVEIETFTSSRELSEKVEYYLNHPDERMKIAKKGHEKFLAMHSWDVKAKLLLNKIIHTH